MNKNIFRAYDIRGNANTDLTDDVVIKIGLILGRLVTKYGDRKIYLGYDSRLSADRIKTSLIRGLNASKVEPVLLGLVPTPLLYYQ
jgi:phosphomannomutase/phosphoglucomutase